METHHLNQSSSSNSNSRPSPPLSTAALTAAPPQPPSFNSYSSEHLADIAARVVGELNLSPHTDPYDDDFYSHLSPPEKSEGPSNTIDDKSEQNSEDEDDEDDESEFEFVVLCRDQESSSPISADQIFDNGHIKPMYPIFNTDLVYGPRNDAVSDRPTTIRLPLRKLMREERENGGGGASCSSSSEEAEAEAEELEGVPPGTYCVWAPKKKSENDDALMTKKSNSTGSQSKRWRFRDLLHRSNSDGKETFVFLTPSQHHHHHHDGGGGGELRRREKMAAVEPKKRRSSGLEGKKKSYLPYRQDLVGFFASANGISRTVRPF